MVERLKDRMLGFQLGIISELLNLLTF